MLFKKSRKEKLRKQVLDLLKEEAIVSRTRMFKKFGYTEWSDIVETSDLVGITLNEEENEVYYFIK